MSIDKENQIKLLIKRINKIQDKGVKDILFIGNQELAEELLKHYQPKLPEDSVVLSRKEYEKLNMKYISALEQLENKSKETAEKYKISMMLSIQEMQKYLEITDEQARLLYYHNAQVAKQLSAEV